jgi:hypothetical protein
MFGAAVGGGLLGWLVGRFTRFEIGLVTGLTIFGGVTMWFAMGCYQEYRAFSRAGPNGLWGEVIKIENVPVGGGAQEVPVVRFTAPDNTVYTVNGPRASGARAGDSVNIIFDPSNPEQSRIGDVTQFRGCAIAMLLFGTFPLSFAVFLAYSVIVDRDTPSHRHGASQQWSTRAKRAKDQRREGGAKQAAPKPQRPARFSQRTVVAVNAAFIAALAGALFWMTVSTSEVEVLFVYGFGAIAFVIFLYAIATLVLGRVSSSAAVGMVMLALNFAVWAWALSLLF